MVDEPVPDVSREEREARERIAALPTALAAILRPVLPPVADEILTVIREEVDEYRRPFQGDFGDAVRRGVELSLGEFVTLIEDPGSPDAGPRMFVQLGRGEERAGRTLDALQAAFRCGARVAWRRFGQAAQEHGAPTDELIALGEAIFAYIHRLSALAVSGWAQEQALREGATQRARDALLRLVTAGRATAPEDLEAAVRDLRWTPPDALAAIVLPDAPGPGELLRIDPQIVAAAQDGEAVGLVPERLIERTVAALPGRGAVLGPTVAWADAARSYRRARTLLELRAAGRLRDAAAVPPGATGRPEPPAAEDAGAVVRAEEHLPEMLVHGDPEAADELAAAVLGPLEALPAGRRARHLETARAWLDHRGHGPRMATALHLHPQTVRYRVARLREALALDLDDPEQRFRLELALRRRGLR